MPETSREPMTMTRICRECGFKTDLPHLTNCPRCGSREIGPEKKRSFGTHTYFVKTRKEGN